MGGYRGERVAELIHKELAQRLRLEVKDPRMEPISITHVKVSRDLSHAMVEYMPLGGGEPSRDLVDALEAAAKALRGPVGRALRLRHAPQISFVRDRHVDEAFRVTQLLDELSSARESEEE